MLSVLIESRLLCSEYLDNTVFFLPSLYCYINMVAEEASRGILLPSPHGRRRRTSSPSCWSSQSHSHHHEVHPAEHSHGPRLSTKKHRLDSSTDDDFSCSSFPLEDSHDFSDHSGGEENIVQEVTNSSPPARTRGLNRQHSAKQSLQGSSVRARRSSSTRRPVKRAKGDAASKQVNAAQKFLREARASDVSGTEVVTYATSLLQRHIQTIASEQLVLDWSSPYTTTELEKETDPLATADRRDSLCASVQDRCNERLGVPVEAFPPSLIKWPGHNNNKQRRLAEIKKQVKLLSSIIKMTIEGAHEQSQSVGSAGAGGYANPAPFSTFVDMSSIPGSALANASADESFLPTIDEITEYLRANKLKEAKAVLRNAGGAVTCPTRPTLWLEMCKRQTTEQYSDSFYYDTLQQIYGTKDLTDCSVVLPAFVDTEHLGRGLTPEGMAACGRIISVLAYYYPPITHAPALHPLAACLLLYMNESDVYNSLSALICSSKVTFATQTKTAHEVAWRATLTLARKHVGAAFSTLEKHGIDSKQVEAAFQNWLWWIFEGIPVPHMIRVIDCFLLEGWKVLVRVALAIFQLFIRQTSRDSSSAALLSTKGLSEAIMIFCQSLSVTPAKLLKTAFGIRALSMSEVTKVMMRTEVLLKRQGSDAGAEGVQSSRDMSSLHHSELPTSHAQANVQMLSHTLNVKELLTIWNWLPVRMTMYQPSLLYTTEEHGSSLTNFYQRVEGHDQTILLVRTTCNHVFGAYCSVAWNTRHKKDEYGNKQTYYGTGESFLFTLRPVPAKYQWVGITKQKQDASLSNVTHSEGLFMHADDEMITIGGGEGQGLMLDYELQFGKTESCKTFDNPPLCASQDFEIKVVEVYGIDASTS